LPLPKTSFILISPPQVQKNFWVTIPTLAFLLRTSAMSFRPPFVWYEPPIHFRGKSERKESTEYGRKVKYRVPTAARRVLRPRVSAAGGWCSARRVRGRRTHRLLVCMFVRAGPCRGELLPA